MAKGMKDKKNAAGDDYLADSRYPISKRELRLRERLESIDEEIVRDEDRAKKLGEAKRAKLQNKVKKARARQEAVIGRHEKSKVYQKSHVLYYLLSPVFVIGRFFRMIWRKLRKKAEHHKQVTPHRSFYLTTRGKLIRRIKIAGYFRFQLEVWHLIWDNKRLFGKLWLFIMVAICLAVGLSSQDYYVTIRDALNESGIAGWAKVPALFVQGFLNATSTVDVSREPAVVAVLVYVWLMLIYALRRVYNGDQIRLRDALYNAGAPVVSVLLIIGVIFIQILPMAFGLVIYSSLSNAGFVNSGVKIENMASWVALFLVFLLTLYWVITSVLCLITATLPGIYPARAYFETSRIVAGRRIPIFVRMILMIVTAFIVWVIVLIPVVILDMKLQFNSIPVVILMSMMLFAATIVWFAAYLYLLYRRILDSPLQPIGDRRKRKIIWPWLRKKYANEANINK